MSNPVVTQSSHLLPVIISISLNHLIDIQSVIEVIALRPHTRHFIDMEPEQVLKGSSRQIAEVHRRRGSQNARHHAIAAA